MRRIFDPPCRWAATAGRALQVLGLLAAVSGCLGAAPSSLAARRSEVALRHDAKSLRLALEDLQHQFGSAYPGGPSFLARLAALEPALETGDGSAAAKFDALRQEALLANPLLRSNQLLVVKRRPAKQPGGGPGLDIAMPSNHECNSSLARTGYDNELGVLSPISPRGEWRTLHRPAHGGYVGEVDLHWNADRLLFTQSDATNWKVFELRTDGSGLRQVSTLPDDVDSFDACYLPNGNIMFGSTATFQSVPCWHGLKKVSNLYLMDADGRGVRQVCFDQDHDFHSTVLPNGQVLYNRWDYTGINHIYLRELMLMNPDGTGQRAIYGSGSWYPNALYFPRPLPGDAGKIVCILSGYHGPHRMGQLVILDTAKGWQDAEGIVQRISGRGDPIKPMVKDNLVEGDWPKFLHPFPLSEKYLLVAAWLHAKANWGIYLADVFDNLVLVREEPGWALLEPVLLKSQPKPSVVPDQVDLSRDDGLVYLHDVYVGPGLQGVPRGTVKSLRVLAYHFGYLGLAGPDRIGYGGPWEVMRILGTVPLEADGSAFFRVPANTPIALQALDAEGKAVQLMRSWFSVMPGEKASCVGCHERPSDTPRPQIALASRREPRDLTSWYGPARGFDFEREVQPVLDRHCVGCHDGTAPNRSVDSQSAEAAPDSAPRWLQRTASPLTPALSPLRGEGARRTTPELRMPLSAPVNDALSDESMHTRPSANEPPKASFATPSPLNGERAGVRGENAARLFTPVIGSVVSVASNRLAGQARSNEDQESRPRPLQVRDTADWKSALHAPPDLRSATVVTHYAGRRISQMGIDRLHPKMRAETQGILKYSPAYDALIPHVRRVGIEDDVSLLTPGEYHADTSPLIQMLRKGHHGVQLDAESWDRLVTWIDLNAPCHGTWGEVYPIPDGAHERRMALRRQFGGPKGDPEEIPKAESRKPKEIRSSKSENELPTPAPRNSALGTRISDLPAGPREKVISLSYGLTLKLVRIPAGEFVMGDPEGEPDEQPLSRVTIARPFWMAACEISNEQFRQFHSTHDSRYYQKRYPALEPGAPGWVGPDARGVTLNGDCQPVVRVSCDEAMAFCRWLSARTGLRFNLPTEAQWEWACRAGTATPFSFGLRDADFSRWANLADVSFSQGLGKDGKQVTGGLEHLVLEGAALSDVRFNDRAIVTAAVGTFQPNAWGLHDLHGNAAEWTRTPYATLPYRDGDAGNEAQPGSRKVVRGGSFFDPPARARSAFRLAYPSWQRVFNVGFRVVCEDGKMMGAK